MIKLKFMTREQLINKYETILQECENEVLIGEKHLEDGGELDEQIQGVFIGQKEMALKIINDLKELTF